MFRTYPVLFLLVILSSVPVSGQALSSRKEASEFYQSLSPAQQEIYYRTFADARRTTWERLPKEREGLKLADLTESQKIKFHRFLQSALSSEGYLMVTAIMFNEDIQKRFEPYLGRNEFYLELFGMPEAEAYWGWQLEGHHLSVNLTFQGDQLISHTPFLLASNPQIVNSDRERNGLCLVYLEEQLAGELAASLKGKNKEKGYTGQTRPSQVFGEKDKNALKAPDDGVLLKDLSAGQQEQAKELAAAYLRYFRLPAKAGSSSIDALTSGTTRFYFMQDTDFNGEHYYRIYNRDHLIECENYGNHSHHFWRSTNDFGLAVIKSQGAN